ncbi:hypothetical protein VNO78_33141 [Psophocarpus tetragonolobus]|uniref:Uncharacterized protein n=1 Tax=Psophocarpus tetragonolobus TaxID=3891 RepID=A0AAN9NWT7_PSOTE
MRCLITNGYEAQSKMNWYLTLCKYDTQAVLKSNFQLVIIEKVAPKFEVISSLLEILDGLPRETAEEVETSAETETASELELKEQSRDFEEWINGTSNRLRFRSWKGVRVWE